MYSPEISPDLVRQLYKIAKARKIPQTKLVNTIIADAIKDIRVETQVVSQAVEIQKEVFVISPRNDSFSEQVQEA